MMANEKKKMGKKKKILIILGSVFLFLLLLLLSAVIYAYTWFTAPIEAKSAIPVSQSQIVQQGESVRLIAHRGLSAQAPENTIAATTAAGKAGFWGAETDIYRTTDGKWVLMHDNYLFRLMDGCGLKKVDTMTYDELMQFTYTNGANIDQYPDLKVSLLSDYLDECKLYGMTPVVEYKSKNNYEFLHEVIEMIQAKGMEKDVVIISFELDALKEFRKSTTVVPLWYLVQELDDVAINEALSLGKPAGIDFNGKNEKLTQENIKKAVDAGLEVGCWTIDDIEIMDKMLSWGVNTITTNLIVPDPAHPETKENKS